MNTKHRITACWRKYHNPDRHVLSISVPILTSQSQILLSGAYRSLKITSKGLHHPRLVNDKLIYLNPLSGGQGLIHERSGYDIAALFANKEEEGWLHGRCACASIYASAIIERIIMLQDRKRKFLAVSSVGAVDSCMGQM